MKVQVSVERVSRRKHVFEFDVADDAQEGGEIREVALDLAYDHDFGEDIEYGATYDILAVRTLVQTASLGHLTTDEASMVALLNKHYSTWKGKVVYANRLQAFNDFDDRGTYEFDPPIAVRIDDGRQCDTFRFHEDWLDTEYDCSPVDPDDPRLEGLRTMTVDGPSIAREKPNELSFESCAIVYPEQRP